MDSKDFESKNNETYLQKFENVERREEKF